MPEEQSTPRKEFIILSEAWYGPANFATMKDVTDQISFGVYLRNPDDGCIAEAVFEWHILGRDTACQLQMFDDSWALFESCPDLFQELAKIRGTVFTTTMLVSALLAAGFTDATPRTRSDS